MSGSNIVHFPEDCRLTTIRDCRNSLLEAFGNSGNVNVDLSAVAHVDVSLVQLLVSAARTAQRTKRVLALTGMPMIVDAVLRRAGLEPETLSHRPA